MLLVALMSLAADLCAWRSKVTLSIQQDENIAIALQAGTEPVECAENHDIRIVR